MCNGKIPYLHISDAQLLATDVSEAYPHLYERGLSRLMHDDLHWLVIPRQVQYCLLYTSDAADE